MSKTGIIFDIKKYAIHDGPGIRTTVFFKGCSMECQWCHNPESKNMDVEHFTVKDRVKKSTKNKTIGYEISVNEVMKIIEKDRVFYDESNGGVTFSGGEPLVQIEFLLELLKSCQKSDIHTVVDTSGEASWKDFEKIINYVDLFLYDLKIIDEELHKKYTGVSNKRVHSNLKKLIDGENNIELRIPLIPGITDTDSNISNITQFISALSIIPEVTLLTYNPLNRDKLDRFCLENPLGKLKVQPKQKLLEIKQQFVDQGINVSLGE
ncbi:glycyl-radical enzyme activating protein [bacterium]|nr:glycyl-radical enzyme activating protein [bacterium]